MSGACEPRFEVVDHRGANQRDENTVPAIRLNARRGQSIEIDVRATSDGHLILMHDRTFTRTTNGDGLVVAETTFAKARTLRTDPRREIIPTLGEALTSAAPHDVDVYLDVKDRTDEVLLRVAKAIRNHDMRDRALVTSWTGKMNGLTDGILLQYKPRGAQPTVADAEQKDASSVGLMPRQMSHNLVRGLRRAGIEVHSRLVSTPEAWDRVTEYRIHGALTNRPNGLEEYCSIG